MFIVSRNLSSLRYSRLLHSLRKLSSLSQNKEALDENNEKIKELIKKIKRKVLFNSEIERMYPVYGYVKTKILEEKKYKEQQILLETTQKDPVPISLKYVLREVDLKENKKRNDNHEESQSSQETPYFPLESSTDKIATVNLEENEENEIIDKAEATNIEVRRRSNLKEDEIQNWMTAYENFDDSLLENNEWKKSYGTPDPKSAISKIPCGGCGAPLHCKDTSIPGYIPSEIFKNCFEKGGTNLQAIICQRCYFLKHHNLALQMRVSSEDYPKVLATISEKRGLIVLMVDLLDFPCSIWPGLADIFGSKTPMVVVGNKVDLLPQDSKDYLNRIKQLLVDTIRLEGFGNFSIKHVALISAKTGYGVEDLITRLNSFYEKLRGDVYLVGCTNVGKSSLFNALLQSDFCKIQAIDLIQRATTSVWPGTTLNLLKFPIKRPSGYRQYLRHLRLAHAQNVEKEEEKLRKEQLKKTKDPKYATLIGHIGITKNREFEEEIDKKDIFAVQGQVNENGQLRMGIDERKMDYMYGKWCFDTPGVVQPDQITNLLTTEELLLTLPKELLLPQYFNIKPNQTVFIAGLSRLDYIDGENPIKIAVFCSKELPITICQSKGADELYNELIESNLAKVPINNKERLEKWPGLIIAKEFTLKGQGKSVSIKDIVLSSSGWIAVAGDQDEDLKFRAWTPEARGVYVRDCILPHAIKRSGPRIKGTIKYGDYKFYIGSK